MKRYSAKFKVSMVLDYLEKKKKCNNSHAISVKAFASDHDISIHQFKYWVYIYKTKGLNGFIKY